MTTITNERDPGEEVLRAVVVALPANAKVAVQCARKGAVVVRVRRKVPGF